MDKFGCCSSYVECSDSLKCSHLDESEYVGCLYRRNLEAGKVFYGKNAFKHLQPQKQPKKETIYLYCWDRLFQVRSRQKNTFSQKLTVEQVEGIESVFKSLNVPYMTAVDLSKCYIDRPEELDPSPANSRVILTLDNEKYHILNYNDYLIKKRYSEKICEAFKAKGLQCEVELVGKYAFTDSITDFDSWQSQNPKPKHFDVLPDREPDEYQIRKAEPVKSVRYVQTTIFDMVTSYAI